MRLEQLTPALAGHGEGPVWDAHVGRLLCVDLHAGDVLAVDPGGTTTRHHVGDVAAALRPRASGGFVVALGRRFALLGCLEDPVPRLLPELWEDRGVRMNDGGCDPQGRFWCGSMAEDGRESAAGALWRLDVDGSAQVVVPDVGVSNGLAWRPDGTAVYVDSAIQRIDVLVTDAAGQVLERRPFVEVPREQGTPDGLVLDAEGGTWVALWDGAAVHRYDADGHLDAVLEVPTRWPTACTFGGADLRDLYVTTSRQEQPDADPVAGAVLVGRPGVAGLPVLPFAG